MADEEAKLFVGGLSWNTTTEKLQQYFSKFGEVVEAKVMKDKDTDHSRGFGFIKYKDASSVPVALKARPHILDDKQIDPKPCTKKEIQLQKKEAERLHITKYKIFIGGLTQNMEEEEVKQYFEKIGPVTEVSFAMSKEDGKNKGFGFVTFQDEKSVNEALEIHFHQIGGKRVEAKRAEPRDKIKQPTNMQQPQMQMQANGYGYGNNNNWYAGAWGGSGTNNGMSGMYGMGGMGGNMMNQTGSYMPNSGYGGYGSYQMYPNSGYGYGSYGAQMGGSYPQMMGNYGQQNSSYGPSQTDRSSGGDSKAYHPYKR